MTLEANISAATDQALAAERLAYQDEIARLNKIVSAIPKPDVLFFATFPNLGTMRDLPGNGISKDGVWWVEQKVPGRATVIKGGREGSTALRLHTEPGDSDVSGSQASERNDLALNNPSINGTQGETCFWAHSILFPDDFVPPPSGGWGLVFDFHDTRDKGGQANLQLFVNTDGTLKFQGHAGPTVIGDNNDWGGNQFSYVSQPVKITKNKWFDFVYSMKWSCNADGFMKIWVNGSKILDHVGPTLYAGYGVYLKLANYHSPYPVACSVVHDRIVKGKTWQSVALGSLQS